MIYDPTDVNVALGEDGDLYRRVRVHDFGTSVAEGVSEGFVPWGVTGEKDFPRPEW